MLLFSGEGKDVTATKEMTDTWKEAHCICGYVWFVL